MGRVGLGDRYRHPDMRAYETQGEGGDRRDCMNQFKAAWEQFAGDDANLVEFLNAKRKRRLSG
jgi:hypothetical protein